MQKGKPWSKYRDGLYEAIRMESFCSNYHYTPEQYRSISDEDLNIMSAIIKGRNMAEKK